VFTEQLEHPEDPPLLNAHSLAALVAITQNVFPARSLRPENSNLWSRYQWRMFLLLGSKCLNFKRPTVFLFGSPLLEAQKCVSLH